MSMMRAWCAGVGLAVGGSCALGQVPRALLTSDAGLPTDFVPGSGGIPISSFTQANVRLSASGAYWAVNVNTSSQPSPDTGWIVVGTPVQALGGFTRSATVPSLGFPMSGMPDTPFGVNDSGDVGFSASLGGGAPFASNELVLRWNRVSNTFTVLAREGDLIPGVGDERWGGILDSVTLLNDGRVSVRDGSTGGSLPSSQDEFLFVVGPTNADAATVLVQSDTFAPTNQLGGTAANINDIFEGFIASEGAGYAIEAGLFPPANGTRCIVVNGEVVLQVGQVIDGVPGTVAAIPAFEMFPGGDWMVRGATSTGDWYLIVNGQLLLKRGDSFPTADANEVVRTISDVDINTRGDMAVQFSSTIDGSLTYRDLVLIFPVKGDPFVGITRGKANVVTAGTQIDLNGDGTPDDAYVFSFFQDSLALGDDGNLYNALRALNSLNLTEADALIVTKVLDVGGCSPADLNADNTLDFFDVLAFLSAFAAEEPVADFVQDGNYDFFDVLEFLTVFAAGC